MLPRLIFDSAPVLYFEVSIFGPRSWATILPMTLALAMSELEANFLSSLRTARTSSKVTLPPTFPSSRSMRMVLPGSTRYCFPPVRITAYMLPPEASDKPQLYVSVGGPVNEVRSVIAFPIGNIFDVDANQQQRERVE